MINKISPKELKEKMDQKEKFILLDVRESYERDICKLNGDLHIPMNNIPQRHNELDKNSDIVVYCRSGQRSYNVCSFLSQQGYTNVSNLSGGILAWADQVDPTIKKY